MAVVPYLLGRNATAYFNEANKKIGDVGTGTIDQLVATWLADTSTQEALNLTDVSYDIGSDFADATTRETAQEGFAANVPVLKNGQITFEIRWLPAVTNSPVAPYDFTTLLVRAWETDSTIAMVFLDWPKSKNPGAGYAIAPSGMASNWSVSLTKSEELRDVQRSSVTLSVANRATWYTAPAIVGS